MSAMKMQVPMLAMRDLKCRHCTSFVSCGPVFVVPDGGILCGRCNTIAKPQFRNNAYEIMATCFLFPCQYWYKYCGKQLEWNEAVMHEENCTHRSKCQLFCNNPAFLCKPERKISFHDDFQLRHVPDRILIHLECNVCKLYLSCDPVYISDDGRNICHRCINNNGIPHGVLRNLAYEKLASLTIFPCSYKNKGCTMRLPYGKELWRHESECSYGINNFNNNNNQKNKKQLAVTKERGVVMTHSGHIYATITPQSALWLPPQSSKSVDANVEIHKEFTDKFIKHMTEGILFNTQEEHLPENESFTSLTSRSSRKTSVSSDSGKKAYSSQVSRESSSPPNNSYREDDSGMHVYSRNNSQFSLKNSTPYNERGDDFARPSLASNAGNYQNNLNYMNYRNNDDSGPMSLVHNPSLKSYNSSELIKPKRADSFKIGNQLVIDELRLRQSLSTRHKRNPSSGSEKDSVISGSTLGSVGNNDSSSQPAKILY